MWTFCMSGQLAVRINPDSEQFYCTTSEQIDSCNLPANPLLALCAVQFAAGKTQTAVHSSQTTIKYLPLSNQNTLQHRFLFTRDMD
jgi:hypothetical protein